MRTRHGSGPADAPPPSVRLVRCAVYTRKSTDHGLEQEFNSLDAQREAGEAYVKSQAGGGWAVVGERYDDGGFTGGTTDRPGLKKLLADVDAGRVDCVVVYKVDRLSRSLLDFAQMMKRFEDKGVAFVSVTQQFNTATSMGRLVLNVLLSFAQFEREIIGERTRDKIAATRRKGKWAGGHPVLGYDVDPRGHRLVVNADEAARVRGIFALYLEHGSLLPTVLALTEKGWGTKRWTPRAGAVRGGGTFTRTGLHKLLTNPVYVGKVRYKDEVHPGEHPAVVDDGTWRAVQATLARNGRTGGGAVRNRFGALLKGLLRCGPCGCAMTPSHSTRKGGTKRYRYYVCSSAQKRGWHTCPSKAVPAGAMEELVVGQVRTIGRDPGLLEDILGEAGRRDAAGAAERAADRRGLEQDVRAWRAEAGRIAAHLRPGEGGPRAERLAELKDRMAAAEERLRRATPAATARHGSGLDPGEAAAALAAFEPVWAALSPREQQRVVHLLVGRVEYDGSRGKVAVAFRPAGIAALARELADGGEQLREVRA